jgi:hypothetical protein
VKPAGTRCTALEIARTPSALNIHLSKAFAEGHQVKTLLLRNAMLVTLLMVVSMAFAQGQGRHGMGRGCPAGSPPGLGLGYGAGYQARRLQQAEREDQRIHQATKRTDDECAPAMAPPREPEPARAKEPGQTPAPARRDTCVATKP